MYHASVLLHESVDALGVTPGGIYVDATFGGGGHTRLILEQLRGKGHLYAFDQDTDAAQNAAEFAHEPTFTFLHSNFRFLKRQLRAEAIRPGSVQGILADLGVSSYQLDTAERGFSYRFQADLDMRMNRQEGPTAADVLNTYDAEALQRMFSELGEVRNARTLAQAVVRSRDIRPFQTTGDLTDFCEQHLMGERMRYLSQVFQALRMEVNDELGALHDFLKDAYEMLAPGGTLLLTVPASMALWDAHDVINEHRRRYSIESLRALVPPSARLVRLRYLFHGLYPIKRIMALMNRRRSQPASQHVIPPSLLNAIAQMYCTLEYRCCQRFNIPWDTSLYAIIEKPIGAHQERAS